MSNRPNQCPGCGNIFKYDGRLLTCLKCTVSFDTSAKEEALYRGLYAHAILKLSSREDYSSFTISSYNKHDDHQF
jgi:hypothetical protein